MPRIGSRKLYVLIQREFGSQPKFPGRDKFLDLLSEQGLLLRIKRRRHYKTTDSNHPFKRYPNLILIGSLVLLIKPGPVTLPMLRRLMVCAICR